jgi:hypothetical protein
MPQLANKRQDLVEVEDWNEYGELKQHVKIVAVSGPGANPAIKAKAPVANNENKKPAVAPAAPPAVTKKPAESKPPAGAAETTITLAMRQVSQAAAQKAKDVKKVATKAVAAAKPEPKASSQPVQTKTKPVEEKHDFETITLLQDAETSTWSARPATQLKLDTQEETIRKLESLQSPTSTAWKSNDGGAAKAKAAEEEDDSSEEDSSEEDSEEESDE